MFERGDDSLIRDASLEEEGIPDTDAPPAGLVLSGDTAEGIMRPGDEPVAAEDYGTTAREERLGESVGQRAGREEPDFWAAGDGDGNRLASRLVQPDSGMVDLDDTPEEVGTAVGDSVGLSAEEAAMHIESEPEGLGGGWPGYLDDEGD